MAKYNEDVLKLVRLLVAKYKKYVWELVYEWNNTKSYTIEARYASDDFKGVDYKSIEKIIADNNLQLKVDDITLYDIDNYKNKYKLLITIVPKKSTKMKFSELMDRVDNINNIYHIH